MSKAILEEKNGKKEEYNAYKTSKKPYIKPKTKSSKAKSSLVV